MESERKVLNMPGGGLLAYYVTGKPDGSPIVLMHGWGCDHTTLKIIEDALVAKHRVYNVDFPGFGESSEPASVWGVGEYTDMLEALIKEEKLNSPSLLGHSFGGRVAIMAASRPGASFAKIILVDAAGIKPHRSLRYYWKVYTYKLGKKLIQLTHSPEKAAEIIERKVRAKGSADYRQSSPMMRAVMSKVVNEDLSELLPLVKSPTLLIWGANDTATPLSDAKKMERLIPDAGLVAFEGCGHYSFLDNPRRFSAVLQSFMNS